MRILSNRHILHSHKAVSPTKRLLSIGVSLGILSATGIGIPSELLAMPLIRSAKERPMMTKITSQPNSIFVSPSGSDSSPGTIARPLKSLERARDLTRKLPRTASRRIVLRGGVYRLTNPLQLGEEDGGTEAKPILWMAAPGEKVVISGGVPLTGWQSRTVNGRTVWSLVLPEVRAGKWFFRSLYGNRERRQRARLPQTGFFQVAGVTKREKNDTEWLNGRDRFLFNPGDLANFPDTTSAEAILLTEWCDSHLPFVSVDTTKNEVVFDKLTIQNFAKDARYWVENTSAGLTQPGQWCLNRETGELLYLPQKGETPANTVLTAPRAISLVEMDKTAHIQFQGITFSHSEWWFPRDFKAESFNQDNVWGIQQAGHSAGGAVEGRNITDATFQDCEFSHLSAFGLFLDGTCRHNKIIYNDFHDLGGGGIALGPASVGKDFADTVSSDNLIADNHLYDGGKLLPGCVAIWAGHVSDTQIIHNHIHDFFYSGISIGWSWGFDGIKPSRNNQVSWNLIHNLGKDVMSDMGAIYTLGVQPGTVIEGNVVHDINGHRVSRGIYLDDGSSEITVKNNLSYRNRTANFFQWRSKNNRIENNIFALGQDSQVELAGAVFNDGAVAMNFERNIIVTDPGKLLNDFDPTAVKSIYKFDNNLIWNPNGKPAVPENVKSVGWATTMLERDPQFINFAKGDFRLLANSVAFKAIGFIPVDWSRVGPRPRSQKVAQK